MSSVPARRRVWICINGILTRPGDAEEWTDRAVTWLHLHTGDQAEKFEYAAGPLTRRLRQSWRADAISRMAEYYLRAGYEVSFVAHSNGADLVERVLATLRHARFRSAHLFAPACVGEVLRDAVTQFSFSRAELGALHLYGSPHDRALALAGLSRRLLGWAGLGYGDLGCRLGPWRELPRVHVHEDPAQGHSSWFARGLPFETTMFRLLENDRSSSPS